MIAKSSNAVSKLYGPPPNSPPTLTRMKKLGIRWLMQDGPYFAQPAICKRAVRRHGSLEVGKLADLAVLSGDFFTLPVARIGGLESVLTLVGGRIVYSAGPYAGLAASEK